MTGKNETDIEEEMTPERRKFLDRRNEERRIDERRSAGIGEVQSDRRGGPRRGKEAPDPSPNRDED